MLTHDQRLDTARIDRGIESRLGREALVVQYADAADGYTLALARLGKPAVIYVACLLLAAARNGDDLVYDRTALGLRGEVHRIARAQKPILGYAFGSLTLDIQRTHTRQQHSLATDEHVIDDLVNLFYHFLLLFFFLAAAWSPEPSVRDSSAADVVPCAVRPFAVGGTATGKAP